MSGWLPLLLLLFAGSGCAALIYEIVWFQLLELVVGSSAVSLGVLLGTFMGGMCLGSIALPRVVSTKRHPLRVYALLELGIAVSAIAVLFGVPQAGHLYAAIVGYGLPGVLLRGTVCALCLLLPAMLMGATLPAMARWVEATPKGVSWLGFFYGGNTLGAMAGCLIAGFYLLRIHDVATATFTAAAVNLAVGAAALTLAAMTPHSGTAAVSEEKTPVLPAPWPVYAAICLSGLSALGAEVVWTRLLSLMLGATVYTFSLILAVFLAGLAAGSSVGSLVGRVVARPRLALGVCQMLLGGAVAWAAYALAFTIPFLPVTLQLTPGPWYTFQLDLMRCLWVVLPAACLWGASFPLALAAAASPGQDAGRLVARVYAANTVGAIIGAAAFSVVLIPWAGTQQSQRLLIAICAASSLIALVKWPLKAGLGLALAGSVACLGLLGANLGPIPWEVIGYGRHLLNMRGFAEPLFVGEGMNSSVAVSKEHDGARQFHISGRVEASSDVQDMRTQRMLGHLPALMHAGPRSALIVGCGAGVTAGTFVVHPGVRQIVICELEPLVPTVVARYFARENHDVLRDPRTQVIIDDARHFIFTTRQKFDVITSDPIHPWIKGAATLYTREYFELCKRRLNPGGVVAQWVPLYESSLETVRSEIATFFEVFPNGTIWSNSMNGPGYDVVLLGTAGTPRIDMDALEARLARPDHAQVAESLRGVRIDSATNLLATYAGQAADLRSWLRGASINSDRDLRLQYLAGLSLNVNGAEFIYDDMLLHRRFPEGLFIGSDARKQALRKALGL